jgi:hypothetical protein
MVSKAREDFPDPERPVTTVRALRGIWTLMSRRLCWRAPRTVIWVMLLELPLALLHFLNNLLLRANRNVGSAGIWCGLRRRKRRLLIWWLLRLLLAPRIIFGWRRRIHAVVGGRGAGAEREYDTPWCTLSLFADDEDIVVGTVKKLRKHVLRGTGAVSAKNALVAAEAFNLDAGVDGNFLENLRQAGVGGGHGEAMAIPNHRSGRGRIVCRPVGRLGRRRCSWLRGSLSGRLGSGGLLGGAGAMMRSRAGLHGRGLWFSGCDRRWHH